MDTEEEDYEYKPPPPQKPLNSHTKEIIVDEKMIQQMADEMRTTGESPISSLPDPKAPNLKPKFTMEEIPMVSNPAGPALATDTPPPRKTLCCGTPPVTEEKKVDPYSAYSMKTGSNVLLPPQGEKDYGKISLVLDLDETLVHSSFIAIPNADFSFHLGIDSTQLGVYVCVRPGAEDFLKSLSDLYELILFTASTKFYADLVVDQIDPDRCIKHRLYRESCSNLGGSHVKDLSKLGRDLSRTIIIDNSSIAYLFQPYNAIAITSWYDDKDDTELFSIMGVLQKSYRMLSIYDILSDI